MPHWTRPLRDLIRRAPTVALVGVLTLAGAPPVLADHGESFAELTGAAQCSGDNFSCDEGQFTHQSVDGAHDFSAADARAVEGEVTQGSLEYAETYDPDGAFRSVAVSGVIEASNSNGGSSVTDASYSIYLAAPGTFTIHGGLSATLQGTELILSSVGIDVMVECDDLEPYELNVEAHAGASYENEDLVDRPIDRTFVAPGACDIEIYGYVSASTNRKAAGQSGSAVADFSVTIARSGEPGDCTGVHGVVVDGAPVDLHELPLRGIQVDLVRDGARVGAAVATGFDGSYCIPVVPGTIEPGDYKLRASLIDALHQPPLFSTYYQADPEPLASLVNISELDFGPDTITNISFGFEAARPYLGDVANIHYQTDRFVRWVTDTLGIPVAVLGTVKVVTFNETDTSSFYDRTTVPPLIAIKAANDPGASTFAARNDPLDNGPDNAEWHEYAHHVARVLDIGSIISPACAGRASHGGWANKSTCDSVAEGFATFLATLASLDIQAGEGGGFGTAQYAGLLNLEDNEFRAWTTLPGVTGVVYREDFAVAQLLWDLADSEADDWNFDIESPGEAVALAAHDRVAIGGVELVRVLANGRPTTVDEMFALLHASEQIHVDLRSPSVELDDDEEPDVSPLGELFLAHGFHPVRDESDPRFTLGDLVARTDHLPAGDGFIERRNVVEMPGAGILLQNSATSPVTFTIEIASPATTNAFEITVPAESEAPVHLEVPPYWRHVLTPGAPLPDCPGNDDTLVTITLSAPTLVPRTIDSCEYFGLIATATGATALAYGATGGPVGTAGAGPTASPTQVSGEIGAAPLAAVAVGVALVLGLVLVFIVRRRRTASAG